MLLLEDIVASTCDAEIFVNNFELIVAMWPSDMSFLPGFSWDYLRMFFTVDLCETAAVIFFSPVTAIGGWFVIGFAWLKSRPFFFWFYLWLLEHSILLATCFSLNLKAYLRHGHVLFVGLLVMKSSSILLEYLFKLFLDSGKILIKYSLFVLNFSCVLNALTRAFQNDIIFNEKTCILMEEQVFLKSALKVLNMLKKLM